MISETLQKSQLITQEFLNGDDLLTLADEIYKAFPGRKRYTKQAVSRWRNGISAPNLTRMLEVARNGQPGKGREFAERIVTDVYHLQVAPPTQESA